MNKEKTKYYLVVEEFDRCNSEFKIVEVNAHTVKIAVEEYLKTDNDDNIDDEIIIDKDKGFCIAGYYVGEEHTIGIGTTKEEACLQYVTARINNE